MRPSIFLDERLLNLQRLLATFRDLQQFQTSNLSKSNNSNRPERGKPNDCHHSRGIAGTVEPIESRSLDSS